MQRDSQGLDLLLPWGHADPELSQARAVCPAQNEKNGQFWGKTAQEWARVWISRVRLTPLSPAFSHTVERAEFNHQFLLSKGVFSIPSSSNLAVSSLKPMQHGSALPALPPPLCGIQIPCTRCIAGSETCGRSALLIFQIYRQTWRGMHLQEIAAVI